MQNYSEWVEGQIKLANALASGSCGGTYADGAIILCTTISAMTSLMWIEKDKTDRKRFIEILVRFSQDVYDTTKVAIPIMAQDQQDCDLWHKKLKVSHKAFCYTGRDDKPETEIISLCGHLDVRECKKFVRKYSYACLLYEQVRCGFVHTYRPGAFATEGDVLASLFDRGNAGISYVNYLASEGMRKIFFPLGWVSEVVKNVAAGMDRECAHIGKSFPENLDLPVPTIWWIEGA